MNTRIKDPRARVLRLQVNLSVEETGQLWEAISVLTAVPGALAAMTENQRDALQQLRLHLGHSLSMKPPTGLKGVLP